MLGVSRASAGEMLKRLEAEGLVERGAARRRSSQRRAASARSGVRKHRIIERLLTDFMGYTAAEAHVHADELGDTFNDDMVERINVRLGNPSAARTAGRSTPSSSRRRTTSSSRSPPSSRARGRRSCGSPSTTAICCTGSTTRGSSRARRSSSPAAAGRRPAPGARERQRARGRGQGRLRPVRPAAKAGPSNGSRSRARRRAQRLGLVDALPREVVVVAAEVAVGRGLRVDRAAQVEVAQDRRRAEVEVLAHERLDLRRRAIRLGVEVVDEDRERVRDADRVGDLDQAAVGEAGGDDVLRDVAGGVGGRSGRPSSGPCPRTRRRRAARRRRRCRR